MKMESGMSGRGLISFVLGFSLIYPASSENKAHRCWLCEAAVERNKKDKARLMKLNIDRRHTWPQHEKLTRRAASREMRAYGGLLAFGSAFLLLSQTACCPSVDDSPKSEGGAGISRDTERMGTTLQRRNKGVATADPPNITPKS